ncbi:MAG TPA: nitrilase-related carbon-nitrogen hydrolase [Candidatus Deferrimicrobium sp.]|nr:nitrilase-related carbon-nitrogen hydrolase [Candidatus Deferrimicrobium sp.]
MLNVSAIQFNPVFLDLEYNRKTISDLIQISISKYNSKLIVLPELTFSGYNFMNLAQVRETAEEIPSSKSCQLLEQLAKDNEVFIIAGINEKAKEKFFNSAVVFGPKGYICTYRKIQLYNKEKKFFMPGDLPLQIFEIEDYKIGIMICFDWFFPEIPRTLALLGADVVCHLMNAVIPDGAYLGDTFHSRWNRIFIVLANRIGEERDLKFIGRSTIIDPTGKLLAQASSDQEEIIHRSIDPTLARNKHLNEKNHVLADRRTEFYKLA